MYFVVYFFFFWQTFPSCFDVRVTIWVCVCCESEQANESVELKHAEKEENGISFARHKTSRKRENTLQKNDNICCLACVNVYTCCVNVCCERVKSFCFVFIQKVSYPNHELIYISFFFSFWPPFIFYCDWTLILFDLHFKWKENRKKQQLKKTHRHTKKKKNKVNKLIDLVTYQSKRICTPQVNQYFYQCWTTNTIYFLFYILFLKLFLFILDILLFMYLRNAEQYYQQQWSTTFTVGMLDGKWRNNTIPKHHYIKWPLCKYLLTRKLIICLTRFGFSGIHFQWKYVWCVLFSYSLTFSIEFVYNNNDLKWNIFVWSSSIKITESNNVT